MEDLRNEVVFSSKIPRMLGCMTAGYVHRLVGLLMGISDASFAYH
jgi:ABC-type enterochelin transport system permease subunit